MPLVASSDLVSKAYQEGYAVAAINTNGGTYELIRAALEVAEESRSPLILACYVANAGYRGLGYIVQSVNYLVRQHAPTSPVALHLDHGASFEDVARAVHVGFTSVMYDGSKLPLKQNIENTLACARLTAACGVSLEAELGHLLSGQADPENPNLVKVNEVEEFLASVDVDMLAVAIGNSHGFYKGDPRINLQRLREVREVTGTPLVLHGSTGLPVETVRNCIRNGMAKVNYGTVLRHKWVEYCRESLETADHKGHPWRILEPVKERLKKDIREILEIVMSLNRI